MSGVRQLTLPDYGLGAAGLGNLYTAIPDDAAQQALDAAHAAGFDYIDTAPFYGHGLSEQRVGAYLAASGARPVLSTKVGRRLESANGRPVPDNGFAAPAPFIPQFDYSEAGIRAAFDGSRERLGVQSVDMLFLHDIGRMTHADAHEAVMAQAFEEALPAMEAMKSEGLTKWIGLGVNEIEVCEDVLARVRLDVLLLAGRYTLLEHDASTPFLNACEQAGVKIVIGGAFNSGLLAASGDEPLHYNYVEAPDWAVERVRKLRNVCTRYDVELPALALQFCRAHPAVASVIPGARTAAQVQQVSDWTRAKIDPDVWTALKEEGLISADAVVPS
ncbi:aldo/keto reductase [uncultured Hyphomonas sp.]|uniref:aldo/keto reductase n=1 Tax=uncultured Hyphomonas sp. TaxID=225298 RepID=UPI002AABC7BA|nr:aldo/keto reductase [uncultured Hyphomonas sp.]